MYFSKYLWNYDLYSVNEEWKTKIKKIKIKEKNNNNIISKESKFLLFNF